MSASMPATTFDRRTFIKTAASAGALLVTIPLGWRPARAEPSAPRPSEQWSLYVEIHPDNTVTMASPVMEMGQFMRTTGPMILAEEMDLDWSRVSFTYDHPIQLQRNAKGEVDFQHAPIGTGGSMTVRNNWDYLRTAGATVRRMLLEEAAARWRIDPAGLSTVASHVIHRDSNRRISYGELAAGAARRIVDPRAVTLKKTSEYRLMGRDQRGIDAREIVTGRPLFGIDTEYPNCLQAVIERAPVIGAEIAGYDRAAALAIPGVRHIVEIPREDGEHWPEGHAQLIAAGIAVIADDLWSAMKGRKALRAQWRGGHTGEDSRRQLESFHPLVTSHEPHKLIRNDGNVDQAFAAADIVLDATYEKSLFAHACMEPLNCLADIRRDGATVIVGAQQPQLAALEVERIAGIDALKVEVITKRMGGGFGRRGEKDYLREAVFLSHAIKRPVKVTWTREDDIERDYFDPGAVMRVRAAMKDGRVTAWHHRQAQMRADPEAHMCFPAELVPNYRVEKFPSTSHIPAGPWRAPLQLQWAFAVESMLDELAHAAKQDPLAFRLALLKPYKAHPVEHWAAPVIDSGRMAACYEAAAKLAEWNKPRPRGTGLGIAGHFTFGSYVACVLQVSVSERNELRIEHAWGAIDCGFAINPNHVRSQMEGGFVDGLNSALFNAVRVEGGRVRTNNFDSLRWIRMREAPPRIEIAIVDSGYPPTGVGEPPLPPAGAALANAIFAASGKRIRRMPIADAITI